MLPGVPRSGLGLAVGLLGLGLLAVRLLGLDLLGLDLLGLGLDDDGLGRHRRRLGVEGQGAVGPDLFVLELALVAAVLGRADQHGLLAAGAGQELGVALRADRGDGPLPELEVALLLGV